VSLLFPKRCCALSQDAMLRKRSYSGTRNEPAGDGAAAPPDPPDGERWQPMTFMEYVEKAHPDLRESGFTREELPSSRATTPGAKNTG